ncbi:amidase family protein [Saccharopolyspora sp. ASAGF58]|uniref:amidase family protein n=1 Tax=Saccharopolyspora sp. ASAGF58 TaxID=2719023 RepID=UPI00143FFDEC|nr:amidase family protein [Saccharopolyspora sp. ASAGF58]QIZ39875.1 hypothetical protein FDZ84_29610 [Saccharopolyspora sp. ASAGF58]
MTGLPALQVPTGFTSTGLPMGVQIVGKPFAEDEGRSKRACGCSVWLRRLIKPPQPPHWRLVTRTLRGFHRAPRSFVRC